jgi:hypothetical protein
MTYASRRDRWCSIFGIVSVVLLFFGTEASSLDTIHMAITGKNFQHVIYPIAQRKVTCGKKVNGRLAMLLWWRANRHPNEP